MRRTRLAALAVCVCVLSGAGHAAEWRVQRVDAPARVTEIATVGGKVHVMAGGLWYRLDLAGNKRPRLVFIDTAPKPGPVLSENALPDGRIAVGRRDIARAWLSGPTTRYGHGVLGDKIEAGALEIEARDGKRRTVRLKDDAVFEDLRPRLADLDGDGFDEIVLVKSHLRHGASLAVIADRNGKYEIVAETPPLGVPNQWLDPAGIADFSGDGKPEIALVRQPHSVGALELWSLTAGTMRKLADIPDASNHVAGTRAIDMSAVADFDGDGIADLALPSFTRKRLRILAFAPETREIGGVGLPAAAVTDFGLLPSAAGPPAIAVGLEDGTLALIRRD
jgi:hypothetical protein